MWALDGRGMPSTPEDQSSLWESSWPSGCTVSLGGGLLWRPWRQLVRPGVQDFCK